MTGPTNPDETASRYRIGTKLGAGGMGEVYRARDERLGREVAIKMLPPEFTHNAERLHRFEREARTIGKLNHPNVLAVYDVGTRDGLPYLVTELLEGETLRQSLRHGALPSRKAVEVAVQLAHGLAAAHDRGVVHRDLKPENVMITTDGVVKILDFGLAKLTLPGTPSTGTTETVSAVPETATGTVVGTVGYMSPEQVRGRAADHRADIFAFGCVLYEMLAGRRPFHGTTPADTMAEIVSGSPPPMGELNPRVPPSLEPLVARCLEKRPEDRFQSIRDVAFALEASGAVSASARAGQRRARSSGVKLPAWSLVVLLLAVVGGGALVLVPRWLPGGALPTQKHLALMRFIAASGDPEERLYAEGVGEHLASSLTLLEEQTHGAVWAAPVSSSSASLSDQQRTWGVAICVEGRLRRNADRFQLSIDALDATTGRRLRHTEIGDRRGNLDAVQVDPVLRLAHMLDVEATPETLARLKSRTTNVGPAFDAYVTGLALLHGGTSSDRPTPAMERLRTAVRLDPLFTPARVAVAEAYLRAYRSAKDEKLLASGIEHAEAAIASSPGQWEAYAVLGRLHQVAGEKDAVAACLELAAHHCPESAEIALALGQAYAALERSDDAEKQYQRAIYLRPGYWPYHDWLGRLYLRRGAYDLAVTQFRQAIVSAPDNYRAYNTLGYVLHQLERSAESRNMFERSLELQPENNPSALNNLGVLYFDDARFADAAAIYERLATLNGDNYLVWGNLAWSHQDSGAAPKRAQECFRRAIVLAEQQRAATPDDRALLCRLAGYYAMVGERTEGRKVLAHVVEATPTDPEIIAHVADAYEDLGDREAALVWVERAFTNGVLPGRFEKRPSLRGLLADLRYQRLAAARRDIP